MKTLSNGTIIYEVGDRVQIVDQWSPFTEENTYGYMDKYLGTVMTVRVVDEQMQEYRMQEDRCDPHITGGWYWNRFCIKGLAEDPDPDILNLLEG